MASRRYLEGLGSVSLARTPGPRRGESSSIQCTRLFFLPPSFSGGRPVATNVVSFKLHAVFPWDHRRSRSSCCSLQSTLPPVSLLRDLLVQLARPVATTASSHSVLPVFCFESFNRPKL